MKNILLCMLLVFGAIDNEAKTMKDVWLTMPDSLMPYTNTDMRLELADLAQTHQKAQIKNLFGEQIIMDTITAEFTQIKLSNASIMQMKLLPTNTGSQILCMVKTYMGPSADSKIALYTLDWKLYKTIDSFPMPHSNDGISMPESLKGLVEKPDTMKDSHFKDLIKMIEPIVKKISLSPSDNSLSIKLGLPLINKKDRDMLNAILVTRKLKWNGETFN